MSIWGVGVGGWVGYALLNGMEICLTVCIIEWYGNMSYSIIVECRYNAVEFISILHTALR